jgi:hypothetical protein
LPRSVANGEIPSRYGIGTRVSNKRNGGTLVKIDPKEAILALQAHVAFVTLDFSPEASDVGGFIVLTAWMTYA